jgi:hypothetical protein
MCVVDQNLAYVDSISTAPTHVQVEQVSRVPLVATLPSHRQDFTHADGRRTSVPRSVTIAVELDILSVNVDCGCHVGWASILDPMVWETD